ncbi:MAG: penicillin acylase family protein [Rhodovarius sp.]|nr:penicillin acylase family protein [Rhodovarius sp.]
MPLRRRRRRLLPRLLFAASAVLLLLVGGVLVLVWSTLPAADQRLALPGLSAPVEITLDGAGIPRIRAATEADAAMALGWLHARDRMFQMEAMRRGAEGRLAEIAGEGALRIDRFMRAMGLADRARESAARLPPEPRAILEAYAAGVNARIAERGRRIAPEFLLLGAPEPWRIEHSLLWGQVMGLWLSGNWRGDLERARLLQQLGPERLAQLFPADATPGHPDRLAALRGLHSLLAALPRFPEDIGLPPAASNAFALAPQRSGSDAALLAADPHLGFQAPILWYLVRIELPEGRFRAGATAPGVPLIVIGRNESLAWGFTTTHSDTQDIFIERLVDPDHYLTEEGPRPFAVREARLSVRGGRVERLRIRESRHGVIISDLDPAAAADGVVLALAAAHLAPGDSAAEGLWLLNRARSIAEARAAAARITSPPQNLLVADAAGGIAMFLTGRTPIRRAGDGSLPVPGHDGSHSWAGFLPFEALPHIENPPSGRLVNANNRPAPPDHPAFLGRHFPGDWRFRRIHALLDAHPRPDARLLAAIQRDNHSLLAEASLPLLRRLPASPAQAMLAAWDGEMAADRPEPLLWSAWARRFQALLLAAQGVEEGAGSPEFLAAVFAGRAPAFCAADCEALAARALAEATAELSARHGAEMTRWRWGEAHVARFEHPLLRFVPVLGALTRLSAPTGGDGQTVNRGGIRGSGAMPFANVHGAGLRLVADLSDPDGLLAIIATGQSGHPLSRHWGDLLPLWAEGRMLRLAREPARVTGRITLAP